MSFEFSHDKDLTLQDLPTQKQAVQSALEFVKQVKISWTKGKQYHEQGQVVHTYNTRRGNDFWMARISHHPNPVGRGKKPKADDEITFDVFKEYVLENHTANELKYIPLLNAYRTHEDDDLIPEDSPEGWKAYTVHYKFPKLFSDREMAVWVLAVQPDPNVKQFFVISLPSAHTVSGHLTRAVYCAIEVVTYKEEEGHVEWLMAQTSDARGSIPRWIQDKSVTASVAADVPCFIGWASQQIEERKKNKAREQEDAAVEATAEKAGTAALENNAVGTSHTGAGSVTGAL